MQNITMKGTFLKDAFDVVHLTYVLSCSVISDSLQAYGLEPTILLWQWDFPGENTEVGCHLLLHLTCIDKSKIVF